MEVPVVQPSPWVAAAVTALLVLSVAVYAQVVKHLFRHGGKVRAGEFSLPDLFVVSVFFVWFGGLALTAFGDDSSNAPENSDDLARGAFVFAAIVVFILVFLRARGLHVRELFGLTALAWWKVPLCAIALLITAYPMVLITGAIGQLLLGAEAEPQAMVKYFVEAAQRKDDSVLLQTMLFGALLAPVAEEFIFRGYIYGVLRRYLGVIAGALINSALFAVIHLNLASLAPLFVLALVLTAAYELTGSLVVSMTMHALFNFTSFCVLLHLARTLP